MAHTFTGDEKPKGRTLYETYRLSETRDGHLIYFVATDKEFHSLFKALGHPEWIDDPRFATAASRAEIENGEILGEKIQAAQLEFTTDELLEKMLAADVGCGPVLSLDELFSDPQLLHNESILEFEHPTAGRYHQARPAARFDKTPQDPTRRMPPLHGEHTDEVLSELGYTDTEIQSMREQGIILPTP